ncbi:putative low-affinity inorganic phosphate transporter [Desulfovibrionales bacterium]
MPEITPLLVAIVVTAIIFDFTNGAHDTANAIATIVSTKTLTPGLAVVMATILNLAGAFLGAEVAKTIGSGIIKLEMISGCQDLVLAALIGATFWNLFTWYLGLPSSSSHALIGGLIGAAVAYRGFMVLYYRSILDKIILPLIFSPLAGFICGYLFMILLLWACRNLHPNAINTNFRKLQIISSAFMAISHGMNDAQKTMGIITLTLYLYHLIPNLSPPFWVQLVCALAMALGTATGGWKIIKTMGHRIFKLEPIYGFAAETAAAIIITAATHMGAPISTTHTISASVLGVGSSKRFSAVRWGIAGNIIFAWILTIPAAGIMGALCQIFFKWADMAG